MIIALLPNCRTLRMRLTYRWPVKVAAALALLAIALSGSSRMPVVQTSKVLLFVLMAGLVLGNLLLFLHYYRRDRRISYIRYMTRYAAVSSKMNRRLGWKYPVFFIVSAVLLRYLIP